MSSPENPERFSGVYRASQATDAVPPPPGAMSGAPFGVLRAAPNPFTAASHLSFRLPQQSSVDLAVFDAAGRRVTTLVSGLLPAGPHRYVWDGKTAGGVTAPAGVYLIRLSANGKELTTEAVHLE